MTLDSIHTRKGVGIAVEPASDKFSRNDILVLILEIF